MYTPYTVYNTRSGILRILCEARAKAEKYIKIACILSQVRDEAAEAVEHRTYLSRWQLSSEHLLKI
jgi:hypothetical protein